VRIFDGILFLRHSLEQYKAVSFYTFSLQLITTNQAIFFILKNNLGLAELEHVLEQNLLGLSIRPEKDL